MKRLRKIAQIFWSWNSTLVEDVDSHKKELATSHQLFGFIYKITYKSL